MNADLLSAEISLDENSYSGADMPFARRFVAHTLLTKRNTHDPANRKA